MVLRSTPLTALGLSAVMLSGVSFAINRGQPKIPVEASAILLQSSVENVSAMVEELGVKNKAFYLPSSMTGDKPKALIPLDSNVQLDGKALPKRFIVKYGSKPGDVGLLVITPGSAVDGFISPKPGCSAGDVEAAISQVLVGTVSLADGVRVLMDGERFSVEVSHPRLDGGKMWIYESLGTPIASIVASVAAQILDRPVVIEKEAYTGGKCLIVLKAVGRNL